MDNVNLQPLLDLEKRWAVKFTSLKYTEPENTEAVTIHKCYMELETALNEVIGETRRATEEETRKILQKAGIRK